MMQKIYILIIFLQINFLWVFCQNQPRILSQNGNLKIEVGDNKTISFRTRNLVVNDIDLIPMLNGIQNKSVSQSTDELGLSDQIARIRRILYNNGGVLRRIQRLENRTRNVRPGGNNVNLDRIRRRLRVLETRVNRITLKLREDNCRSNPCQNGGTCFDMYDSFFCQCPKNWQGRSCSEDVNECALFAGTDLGCQNGASCVNMQGSYECRCAPGFFGTHCASRTNDCSTSGAELCGHGVCVHANNQNGYKCICDQGWKTNDITPACTVDVNECLENKPHCSKDPEVDCINLPGSFMCGRCPPGYTGNGYYCTDVDECESNNGGCSTAPFVECINTRGSVRCGSCPHGFTGDGKTCVASTGFACSNDNLCHPLARCVEYQNSIVNCICPPGYAGSGYGPQGCLPSNDTSACPSNFCQNGGTCYVNGTSFACRCPPGTLEPNCYSRVRMCDTNPCLNGGTCTDRDGSFYCSCPRSFTGIRCQTPKRSCGGRLRQNNGTLKYPEGSDQYRHNTRCAWIIQTLNSSMVLNVTFKSFDFEGAVRGECRFDWLQIHDGPTSSAYMIGRFCGNALPKGGNILSTHNALYLWFRSDNSTAHDGFELTWEAIQPVCGGDFEVTSHGVISSPGSPGNYPMNRDCYWRLTAPPGKRLQLNFHSLHIEAHVDCAYDFLAVYDGNNQESPLLEKFCNSSNPEPLLTPKNEALLHFHSDDDNSDTGFTISYNVQPGIPGCGGLYTAEEGLLTSPVSYEDKTYPNNVECDYLIRQPKNVKIQLTIMEFHLEDSSDCNFDYLEIYDGKSTSDPLIGRFCHTSIPRSIKSESNEMLLRFKTDWSTAHGGFSIKYKAICGGTFSESSGIITSPYYPKEYPGSADCRYEIEAPLGSAIELDFEDLDMEQNAECSYDFIEIFDGHTSIGKYCGSSKPSRIVSTYNYLTIAFQTDNTMHGRGFKANYTFVNLKCGGIVKANGSIITPPLQEGTYENDCSCKWLIVAPEGFNIQMNWVTFEMEGHENCTFDYVEVFDNSTQSGASLGRFCETIPPVMTTVGNIATVFFKSDSSHALAGFSLRVDFMNAKENCGGTFFSKSGYIRSPGWPHSYVNNKACEWIIQVPSNNQIQLSFKNFSVEESTDCKFDMLLIRNGAQKTSPLIGSFCGTTLPPNIRSFGNQLYLQFVSDGSRSEAGFEIEWTSASTGCGGTLSSYKGTITSPQYPDKYSANALCSWRVIVSQGSKIRLVFSDFDLEADPNCNYDYLEVFDGKDASAKSLGKYCDSNNHPLDLQTTSNYAFVRFVSDRSNQNRGFSLNYMSVCNTTLTGWNGVIESPNFPQEYPHKLQCEWKIETYKGNKVYVEFTDFDFEVSHGWSQNTCPYDYVKVTQYQKNETVQMNKYCDEKPKSFTSVDNQVSILMSTDQSGRGKGFRLEWSTEGCGGILTKPRGTLTTPNYPNAYPHDVECVWDIQVDFGKTVELTITDLDIENSNDCKFDGLKITTGGDLNLDVATLCHSDRVERKIVAHGHQMRVHFFSDSSLNHRGFSATYNTIDAACGGLLTNPSGMIYSPNYPKVYGKNETCEWRITVDASHKVELSLKEFDLEPSMLCTNDILYIYDGEVEREDKILLKACGNSMPNQTSFTSSGNNVLVVMKTDAEEEYKGFNLQYKTSCGSYIRTNESGMIHLSDITRIENYNCTWVIEADDLSQHVSLTVTHIESIFGRPGDTDCFTFLRILDGTSLDGPERAKICEMKAPPTIVSNGNALTIHLEANRTFSESLIGLDIVVQYSVFDNACGGTLTSYSGSFASPSWPLPYPANVECIWIVKASPGNSLSVTLRDIDIEESENCITEYLEIRENNGAGQLLGVYCGTTIDQNHTNINTYWIRFKSGQTPGSSKGFIADYSYVTHNELTALTDVITSPLFPRHFLGDHEMTYRVTVEVGRVISIDFERLAFSSKLNGLCMAFIKIYDGYDETAVPLVDQLCGFEIPDAVTSTTNVVYIVARLDSFNSHRANMFKMRYRAINPKKITNATLIDGCGGDITLEKRDQFINVTSPGYANGGYAPNLNCTWNLYSANPQFHPAFYFAEVDLEDTVDCLGDYVQLSTSKDAVSWTKLDRICNVNFRNTLMYRPTFGKPYLRVNFRSDFATNRTGFAGIAFLRCGGELTGPNGVISNMNTTVMSMNDVCLYNITVRPGKMIKFKFKSLHLPKVQDKCASYVMFKNGRDDTAPLLGDGKYCGVDENFEIPQTSSRYAFIKVFTHIASANYALEYTEVGVECGGQILLTERMNSSKISTPNFPNIPHPHSECIWNVVAPNGEAITLSFMSHFDLYRASDCSQEYIEVLDGGSERANVIDRFCGNRPPNPITSTSNRLRIKFFTDIDEPRSGFEAEVKIATCGGKYTASDGTIASNGFGSPGAYPANTECVYTISGPLGRNLELSFKQMDLPQSDNCSEVDHLEIYVGSYAFEENSNGRDLYGIYCGNVLPPNINAGSNDIVIKFKTFAAQTTFKGFQLRYNASYRRCRQEITAESGVITSFGYPNRIVNTMCEWRITVPKGRRVTVEIVDLDFSTSISSYMQRIAFYNSFTPKNRIKTIHAGDPLQTISSSDNKMLISAWSRQQTNNRGFKMVFSSNETTLCQGSLDDDSGTIYAPQSNSSYTCEYERTRHFSSGTLMLELKDIRAGSRRTPGCRYSLSKLEVQWKSAPADVDSYFALLCGNETREVTLFSPFYDIVISAYQTFFMGVTNFTLNYRLLSCGGQFSGSRIIEQPTFGNTPSYSIGCGYYISQKSDTTMHIAVKKLKLTQTCDKEYIQLHNGPTPMSPHLVRYCGNSLPDEPLNTQSAHLYLFYYSETFNPQSEFRIDVVPTRAACGGVIHMPISTISSPSKNGTYFNNMECVWELRADAGYTIDLWFKDRFFIEEAPDCSKDYVEITTLTSLDTWTSLGKFCGRHLPPVFNTTSSKVKVKLRTDATNVGDGFTLEWKQKCGGIFFVTDDVKTMISPRYPEPYDPNLNCNYTFVAPSLSDYINIVFKDFQLEETSRRCNYDNLTIYKYNEYSYNSDIYEKMSTFCRKDSPGNLRLKGKAVILFQSDMFHEKAGFLFEYHLDRCGGDINESTILESPKQDDDGNLPAGIDCVWRISAPIGKIIVIRFEKVDLEHSEGCNYDYINVYRSHNMSEANRAAKLCGDFLDRSISLNSQTGVLQLKTDSSNNAGGFRARITMTTPCAETITLRDVSPIHNIQVTQQNYVPSMDCHYLVQTDLGYTIQGKFNRMHVLPCNHNATDNCSCSFVEVRNGRGPFAELIGKYCGHEIPAGFQSSANFLWIRFVTSSQNDSSSGIDVELKRVPSVCGIAAVNVTKNETFTLEPPRVGGKYLKNLHCVWAVETAISTNFEIIVENLDMEDPNDKGECVNDFLKITDDSAKDYINDQTFGNEVIYKGQSGSKIYSFYMGLYRPQAPHVFCGKSSSNIIYYTSSNKVHVRISTNSDIEGAGFKLKFIPAGSCHDYDGLQGRINVNQVKTCNYLIKAPQNYTISVFFNSLYFYEDNCTSSGLKIFDGEAATAPSLVACGYTQPNPFFSTSNIVKVAVNAQHEFSGNYDLTYVATDQGRGCGGTILNYGGMFTSPLYPQNNRNETDCVWTIHVPRNVKVALRFAVFDFGSKTTCNGNYVQILEKNAAGEEEVKRQYCGEDEPAVYRSETSIVAVKLKTTRNFAGTGFIANFMGVSEDSKLLM
ncbi:cubilin homolog [Culicoides brevitarsis]|uniref:cubilin homolog n=1 Tax=Culicoides brevitarsis TaxID=469753 RepID=UPI00307C261C